MSGTHHSRVGARSRAKLRKWSDKAARERDAIRLENGVFRNRSAHDLTLSVKRTIEMAKGELRSLFGTKP